MNNDYDVTIIGGGPGGYLAAERLGHAGKKVLLIESQALGGTCLNVGCIPTKTLLNSAKIYAHTQHGQQFGVQAAQVDYDWTRMQAWKDEVVTGLVAGVGAAEKKAKVDVIKGFGIFEGSGRVRVDEHTFRSEHVILATGSTPVIPPIPGLENNPTVVDSTGALAINQVPKKLVVIGGGVIGLEFACLFATLGTEVTVIEMMTQIAPFADSDLAMGLQRALKNITFNLGCKVESLNGGQVSYTQEGKLHTVEADTVLVAVGRRPVVTGWGAENTQLDYSAKGIVIDDRMRTNLPNTWAIGDVTGRSLLAHAAYRMGEVAAANILNPQAHLQGEVMRWHTIPWCVYSIPELAGIGLTEDQAKAQGRAVLVGKVPAQMSGRFVAENGFKASGLAKVIVDAQTKQVLGIQVLGAYAAEMIWGTSAVLETELTLPELRQLVFPHPTVSELIREAAWAVKA